MRALIRKALWVCAACTLAFFAFAGTQWLHLLGLPFNEEGRFFDANESVVYERDGLLGWGLLAGLALAAAILATFLALRLRPARASGPPQQTAS